MNRTVLITGASRGIGRQIALTFAQSGYNIIATCIHNEAMMLSLKSEIESFNVDFHYYVGDLSDFEESNRLYNFIIDNKLNVDILINNAGISVVGLLQDITALEWNKLWNTNVTSMVALSKALIPLFLNNGSGKILNISSVWGNVGASCEVAYSATKGAVNSFTKALAKELAPSNIQVNAISCGIIDTDMNAHLSKHDIEDISDDIPVGRIGTPQDIADVALSIVNAGNYLTGQIITVDGGWT